MTYSMEELVPIAGSLMKRYCGYENSSLTYEKAEQLMGAVLYCIHEYESGNENRTPPAFDACHGGCESEVRNTKVPATDAYRTGYELVVRKAKKAVVLYNRTAAIFRDYRLRCLNDTFRKGLPEFFRHYDARFNPQDTILTLDYPVLENLQALSGIDRIYEYLRCILLEQKFLGQLPFEEVTGCLTEYHFHYEELFENICHVFLLQLAKKQIEKEPAAGSRPGKESASERQTGKEFVSGRKRSEEIIAGIIEEYTCGDPEIRAYLMKDLQELSAWLRK